MLRTLAILALLASSAEAGERVACQAARGDGPQWHYRTKIPGYTPGVRDDKCWYMGEAMKSRDELYWPVLPMEISEPPWDQWDAEPWRQRGAAPGWSHKE